VDLFYNGEMTSSAMAAAINDVYSATFANVFLTGAQKLSLKELVLFWNQHFDLAGLVDVIDRAQPDGRTVFRVLDMPRHCRCSVAVVGMV